MKIIVTLIVGLTSLITLQALASEIQPDEVRGCSRHKENDPLVEQWSKMTGSWYLVKEINLYDLVVNVCGKEYSKEQFCYLLGYAMKYNRVTNPLVVIRDDHEGEKLAVFLPKCKLEQ